MRVLLVSNGVILAALALLYGVFGSLVVCVVLGLASATLWSLLPLTDPYRREELEEKRRRTAE